MSIRQRRCRSCLACVVVSLLAAPSAIAQGTPDAGGLWQRANLLDDMGGLRPYLAQRGMSLGVTETSEVLGNLTGGVRRGSAYDGVTEIVLSVDAAKALGWTEGAFNLSLLQIHGQNLSAQNLYNLQTVSGVTADPSTRLWELWFQRSLMDGKLDVKIGQQSLDQEFMVSQYSGLYLNTMMGWPMLPSADLYAGGPAYPLSSLGLRVQADPTQGSTLLAGVFDDNPPGGPFGDDSQVRGRESHGTAFNLDTGALFIAELQYPVNLAGAEAPHCDPADCGLPGSYKLGAWYDTAGFADQRYDSNGLSLADPASNGVPLEHRGNFSVYVVADQRVWRERGGPRSVGVFARVMGAPADRNPIDFSVNAGINLKAPLPGRDDDILGLGYGLAHVSRQLGALDADTGFFSGAPYPVRGTEHFVELTYQWQAAPWWVIQPDLQYVWNPGGGIPNPLEPTTRIGDELVLGLRTVITF
ncbi:MAG TPA: carbohydrate porin [Casimicrobiaceae bacterium]|nr:carbohydrate porin [Casimicrobiaceae bacterium]